MKLNKSFVFSLIILVIAASLYRIWPERPYGFAPQWAMAVFAGAVVKNRKLAILLPLLSMFISDALYQVLYLNGVSSIPGFYEGQVLNYVLFGSLVVFGMMIRHINVKNLLAASLAAPSAFFLISNFIVWAGGGGYARPKSFYGLLQAYSDGVPFYQMSLISTVVFSFAFFGAYLLMKRTPVLQQA